MKKKVLRWIDKHIITPMLRKHNRKVEQEWDDYNFLLDLCIENRTLDLNKYNRLMSMVKRKYK